MGSSRERVSGFLHGVASGDPLADWVIIWTRLTPPPGATFDQLGVDWQIATDPSFAAIVAEGKTVASPDHDYTVSVDVEGLRPGTTYHYRFTAADGERSPVGTTLTAPVGDVANLRIGLVSCSSWSNGYFNAYGNLAARDVDLVVHVGDYIYEGTHRAGRPARPVPRPDPATRLGDYRSRYALYRTDPDLQALHARHPMVAVWDDHEFSSGAWSGGGSGHHPRRHGPWAERRAAAVSAYVDWMPVRLPAPSVRGRPEPDRIYRSLPWGDLADLFMLDTRLVGRDRPASDGRIVWNPAKVRRNLLGEAQRQWLTDEVAQAHGRWRLLGNQVMMAPAAVLAGRIVNPDQWDGYPQERRWLYDLLGDRSALADGRAARSDGRAENPANVAVLSGDLHSSWASDLPVGAEFVTPGVTARSFASSLLWSNRWAPMAEAIFRWQNRHVRMVNLRGHGYVVVDITPERVQADFWHVGTLAARSTAETYGGGWQLFHGRPGLVPAPGPLADRA